LFSEGVWVANRRHGKKVKQYRNNDFLVSEGSYNLGAKDGPFKIFSAAIFGLELGLFWEAAEAEDVGSICIGFKSNSKEGIFKSYFRNGNLQKVGCYKDNMIQESTVQQFYKNGQMKYIAEDWQDNHEGNMLTSSGYI
jgi:antitoxin component YwqK of YwqJK toxin-antitoxin module